MRVNAAVEMSFLKMFMFVSGPRPVHKCTGLEENSAIGLYNCFELKMRSTVDGTNRESVIPMVPAIDGFVLDKA